MRKSFAPILGFLVFLIIVVWAAGDYIDGIKATMESNCSKLEQAFGECE